MFQHFLFVLLCLAITDATNSRSIEDFSAELELEIPGSVDDFLDWAENESIIDELERIRNRLIPSPTTKKLKDAFAMYLLSLNPERSSERLREELQSYNVLYTNEDMDKLVQNAKAPVRLPHCLYYLFAESVRLNQSWRDLSPELNRLMPYYRNIGWIPGNDIRFRGAGRWSIVYDVWTHFCLRDPDAAEYEGSSGEWVMTHTTQTLYFRTSAIAIARGTN